VSTSIITMAKPFAVVKFSENEEKFVSVISTNWLSDNKTFCSWPTGLGSHQKLVNHSNPDDQWLKYTCKIIKYCGKNIIIIIMV
jgi:hypothetical protein